MPFKQLATCALAASIIITPVAASAHWHHEGFGLFAAGAAIVGVTAAVLSAPFVAINQVASQPYYAPQPAYYSAQPAYYAPQPAYQQYPQPAAYYGQGAPAYYAPQPAYYAPSYYSYR